MSKQIKGPLERKYGVYRIVFREGEHVSHGRPTPHVEVWKESRKLGNYDMASGRVLFKPDLHVPKAIEAAISNYLQDPQVQKKITDAVKQSFFDLSKPAGQYGGIPRGFKATVSVQYTEESLRAGKKPTQP